MAEYLPDIRNEIMVLAGDPFFSSVDRGDVGEVGQYKLFHKNTRFLSCYRGDINGPAS
jgi:hypothetical protein